MDTIEYAEIQARGIPLDRQGRVSQESLIRLRQALAGQQLALDNLGGFLKFANRLLEDAEKRREHYYDVALAIVDYGDQEFWFVRKSEPLGANVSQQASSL